MTIQGKISHQKHGLDKWDIYPIKWVFSWTQSKEIISSQLYLNLQRALSPKEYFFKWNNSLFKKNNTQYNKQIYNLFQSYIIIDPDKLPDNFVKLFELNPDSDNIQSQVESIFKKAKLLDRNSARIVFVDDKIVIFRNEERLTHKDNKKLTKWQKRRSEIVTTFNTFSNIYDAVRSQYHTISSSQDKQDDYKLLQKDILTLAQEIKFLWYWVKDWALKRSLDSIISNIQNATNAKVLAANLQNLQKLTFTNRSIDSNLLQWAKNKLSKRFKDLQSIIGVIQNQLNELENILTEHQSCLDLFLSQIQFTDLSITIESYNRWYKELFEKYWAISPFNIFYQRINKYKHDKKLFPKFLERIKYFLDIYKDEHTVKLSWEDINDQKLEAFKEFKLIKNSLSDIERLIINS